jgi:hypothetical protein
LNNAGALHDDFWCLFLNIWIVFATLIVSGIDWMLPGTYTPTYEMCSCTLQNYSEPKKFEKTTMAVSIITLFICSFVAIIISIYKYKIKSSVQQVAPNQTHYNNKLQNKLLADLALTIGSVLLIIAASSVKYIFSSTQTPAKVDFNSQQYFNLLELPITLNSFSILFYARHASARNMIFRELKDCLIQFNE